MRWIYLDDIREDICYDGLSSYDVAKYVVENKIPMEAFKIHSMNPVGAKNIRQLLTYYGYMKVR